MGCHHGCEGLVPGLGVAAQVLHQIAPDAILYGEAVEPLLLLGLLGGPLLLQVDQRATGGCQLGGILVVDEKFRDTPRLRVE